MTGTVMPMSDHQPTEEQRPSALLTERQHDCEKWSVYDDEFAPLTDAPPTPETVSRLAMDVSDAPVADKSQADGAGGKP